MNNQNNNIKLTAAIAWAESLPRKKGKQELIKHLKGERLTARQRLYAGCFRCSSGYDTGEGCQVEDCPLVALNPYNLKKNKSDLCSYDDCTEQGDGIV